MLYSWMNEGTSFYVNFHAEEVLRKQQEKKSDQAELEQVMKLTEAPILELKQETLQGEEVFLDFDRIKELTKKAVECLDEFLPGLMKENRVHILNLSGTAKRQVEDILVRWDLPFEAPDDAKMKQVDEIIKSNLFILMENGQKGRCFDIYRLLRDGENCMYYFFYLLAKKMQAEELVKEELKGRLCLIPGNEQALVMTECLGGLLGIDVFADFQKKEVWKDKSTCIIVRDVIHMSSELDVPAAQAAGRGVQVRGAVCLVDILTGLKPVHRRVSLHTINLEDGLFSRMKDIRDK